MKYLLFSFMTFWMAMCSNESNSEGATASYDSEVSSESIESFRGKRAPNAQANPAVVSDEKVIAEKIIKTADVNIEVEDLKKSKAELDVLINAHDAYYEKEQYHSSDYQNNYNLVIRVPSERFDQLMTTIEETDGYIQSKNVSSKNVTEEYIDVSMRLNNSRKYLAQYNELLKRANTIKEMLEVQEKIRILEQEIEARQGRLNYLDNQSGLSTIRITLSQRNTSSPRTKGFGAKLLDALDDGFGLLKSTILFFATLWPYLLIIGLLFVFRKRLGFNVKSKKKE